MAVLTFQLFQRQTSGLWLAVGFHPQVLMSLQGARCHFDLGVTELDGTLFPRCDGPTIGLLLCKSKDRIIVEYALRDTHKPVGVAEWQLTRALPADLSSSLPAIDVLEAELTESNGDDPGIPDT